MNATNGFELIGNGYLPARYIVSQNGLTSAGGRGGGALSTPDVADTVHLEVLAKRGEPTAGVRGRGIETLHLPLQLGALTRHEGVGLGSFSS